MQTPATLQSLFEGLGPPPAGATGLRFSTADIPGTGFAKVGRSVTGSPALLLAVPRSGAPPQEIRLRNLTVLFSASCRITGPNGSTDEDLAVVACEGEAALYTYFFEAASAFVASLGATPTADDADQVLRGFVELFRAIGAAPRKTTQGLWGELLVMALSDDVVRLFDAWHDETDDRYDFAEGNVRIEVKTCGRSRREHHFSLGQLTGEGVDVYIASLMVETSPAGTSIDELLFEIGSRLAQASDVALLRAKAGTALGASWRDLTGARFDRGLATRSLRVFRAAEVPRVPTPLPTALSRVTFVSDLSGLAGVDTGSSALSGLLVGCLP